MQYLLICFIGSEVTISSYYSKADALKALVAKREELGTYFPANIVECTGISSY